MPERNSHHLLGLIALSLALIICALIGAGAIKQVKRAGDTITVTGSAKQAVRSDFVVWRGAVTCQQENLQEAYRVISRHDARLREYLRLKGVPDSSITYYPVQINEMQESAKEGRGLTGRIMAYQMRQRFEVRSAAVEQITQLANQISELLNEGIALESYPLEYLYTQLAELRPQILSEAAKDAKLRAESIAESVGGKIGAVRNLRMGVFQITARNSTDVSDYGMYDTSALEKDVTAVVSITFAVK